MARYLGLPVGAMENTNALLAIQQIIVPSGGTMITAIRY